MYRASSIHRPMTGKEKLLEAIKPWICCNKPRHNNKKYHDLEKSGDSTAAYNISGPITIEVNGKLGGDLGGAGAVNVQELSVSQTPKRLDESFDPKFPPATLGSYAPDNEKQRAFDYFQYTPQAPSRITQIIDSYGDYGGGPNGRRPPVPPVPPVPLKLDDDHLRSEIEFIRAAARKYPDNADLSAAADATYLVDENGEPRPEMIMAIDKVLGGSARERQHMSRSTISDYSNSLNLIQPLHPKPARCRDSEQPRQLLRSMDERKQLEQRLLNIQRSLSQRKKDKTDSLLVPPSAHGPQGLQQLQHREVIDELIDDFYDDDCPQVNPESLPKPPPPSAQPRRAPTLSALNPRRNTFRNSNPLDDSRFSLNYSEYIYEEYGKPSPTEVMFPSIEHDPGLMRSVSQRPAEPPLRRTRSSETIVPQKTLMLARTDSVVSAPGNRIDRWLSKQNEIYGVEDSEPVPIANLPRLPKASRLSKRPESLLRRNSIGTAEDYWPSARDMIPSPGFPPPANSCVGIPYSAMLRKDPAPLSVVSANTYHSASSVPPPPSEVLAQQYISELQDIRTGTGRHSMEDLPSRSDHPTGLEAGKMI